jgi:hypothetical protein
MSAFNVVVGQPICPVCGTIQQADVQFRYGDTWQYTYRPGDRLRWGGNDAGSPDDTLVLVEGVGPPCVRCGTYLDCEIQIVDGVIVDVRAVAEPRDFPPEGYQLLAR